MNQGYGVIYDGERKAGSVIITYGHGFVGGRDGDTRQELESSRPIGEPLVVRQEADLTISEAAPLIKVLTTHIKKVNEVEAIKKPATPVLENQVPDAGKEARENNSVDIDRENLRETAATVRLPRNTGLKLYLERENRRAKKSPATDEIKKLPKRQAPPSDKKAVSRAYNIQEASKSRFQISLMPLLFGMSSGLVGLSVFGLLFLFWPVLVQEARYRLVLSHQSSAVEGTYPGFPAGDQWSPPNTDFSIVVPKIDAKAPIVANIDPANETQYREALKTGVAQARGTCFPGMDCTMYLFAHSAGTPAIAARYNAVFYLLGKLEKGDQMLVYYEGKKILYDVTGKLVVSADEIKYLTERGSEEQLILQTCDPPGTTINRLLVFAKPRLVEYLK